MIHLRLQKWPLLVFIAAAGFVSFGSFASRALARATTATFTFGGSSTDVVFAMAVDTQFNIYLAGSTNSRDLPGTQQAFQKQLRGVGDAFVAKFDASGRLLWTTYLGGSDSAADQFGTSGEAARAVGVDSQGNVYLAGWTTSSDFPTVNAYQAARRSTGLATDGFLTKLDPNGGRVIYSTYVGGAAGSSRVESLSVGPASEVWVGINTTSRQFDVTHDLSTAGAGLGVVGRFQPSGMPVWMTRIGSVGEFAGLAVDPFAQPTVTIGNSVTQLDPSGTRINFTWSTPNALARYLAAGADGTIAVVGAASAEIAVKNAWQPERDPAGAGFLALLNSRGSPQVVTYLPGAASLSGVTSGNRVAVDPSGGVHVAFDSASPTLSPLGGGAPPHPGAPVFASVDRGDTWAWSSRGLYLGGVAGMAIDAARDYAYALTSAGVFRSADRGASWSLLSAISGLSSLITSAGMALDPRDSRTMYVGATDLWRLDHDGRASVLLRNGGAGVAGFRVQALAVNPFDGSVWVGSGNGIEVSFDRGVTWAHRDRGFTTFSDRVASVDRIVFDARRPGTVYAQAEGGGGIYQTVDNGLNWQSITTPLRFGIVQTFELDPAVVDRIYAGTSPDGLLVTDDGGRRWSSLYPNISNLPAPGSSFTRVSALAVSPIPPFQVYATTRDSRTGQTNIITSSDRGATWYASRHADQRILPTRLLAHPTDRDFVFSAAAVVGLNPFVMRMDRRNGLPSYSPSFASVLPDGSVGAIAATFDGQTIVALNGSDITVLKIGR